MPANSLTVDQIWQSLNTATGKRGGISSLSGLPGVVTKTRTLPGTNTPPGPAPEADPPVRVEGPELEALALRLQVSVAERDQFLVRFGCV